MSNIGIIFIWGYSRRLVSDGCKNNCSVVLLVGGVVYINICSISPAKGIT